MPSDVPALQPRPRLNPAQQNALRRFVLYLNEVLSISFEQIAEELNSMKDKSEFKADNVRFYAKRHIKNSTKGTELALYYYALNMNVAENDTILKLIVKEIKGEFSFEDQSTINIIRSITAPFSLSQYDVKIACEEISGQYLMYHIYFEEETIMAWWLEVKEDDSTSKMPCYTLKGFSGENLLIEFNGVIIPEASRLNFIGSRKTPPALHFSIISRKRGEHDFLYGTMMSVILGEHSFATKVYLKRLPNNSMLDKYIPQIGYFSKDVVEHDPAKHEVWKKHKEIIELFQRYIDTKAKITEEIKKRF